MLNSKAAITNWSLPLIKRTSVSKAALQSIYQNVFKTHKSLAIIVP